jgi:single-strand DNA-binding protein
MSGQLTVKARLTRDPEKRITNNGKTMAVFGIANNERIQDPATKEWSDGDPMFLDCVAWGSQGEVILDNLGKGDLVRIEGLLKQRWWEDKDGQKRSKFELTVQDITSSLRRKSVSEGRPKPDAASYDSDVPFLWDGSSSGTGRRNTACLAVSPDNGRPVPTLWAP